MKRVMLLSAVMLVYVFGVFISSQNTKAFNKNQPEFALQNRLGVSTLIPPGMPVSIDAASASLADGRALSDLKFIVTNKTSATILKIKLTVFVLNQSGYLKSAEGWMENLNLKAESSLERGAILRNAPWAGDRVVIVLEYARAANEAWRIGIAQEPEALKTYIQTGRNILTDAQNDRGGVRTLDYLPEMGSDPVADVCSERLAQARLSCLNGLASFSCDPGTGTFSFTCK